MNLIVKERVRVLSGYIEVNKIFDEYWIDTEGENLVVTLRGDGGNRTEYVIVNPRNLLLKAVRDNEPRDWSFGDD